MNVEKRGFNVRIPDPDPYYAIFSTGFLRKGHYEPVTPTPEQVEQHRRAEEVVKEIEENPYVRTMGYDWEIDVAPLETQRWVHDETEAEWLARFRAAEASGDLPESPHARTPIQKAIFDHVFRLYQEGH